MTGRRKWKVHQRRFFSQVEKMKDFGLDVPQVTELVYYLNKMGRNFPMDTLSINEFIDLADKNGYNDDFSMEEVKSDWKQKLYWK